MWLLQPLDVVRLNGKYYTVEQILRSDIPGSIPRALGHVTDFRPEQSDRASLQE
jgi:hypothetical protein